jgi:hypothetical protein
MAQANSRQAFYRCRRCHGSEHDFVAAVHVKRPEWQNVVA